MYSNLNSLNTKNIYSIQNHNNASSPDSKNNNVGPKWPLKCLITSIHQKRTPKSISWISNNLKREHSLITSSPHWLYSLYYNSSRSKTKSILSPITKNYSDAWLPEFVFLRQERHCLRNYYGSPRIPFGNLSILRVAKRMMIFVM